MKVSELQPRTGKVEIILDIVEKSEPREFQKFGNSGKVCNAKAKDDTGEITVTLWNDDIDKVNVGGKIKITNGWVGEWQGEMQLSTGKFGTLEVMDAGSAPAEPTTSEPAPESAPEEAPTPSVEEEKI